MWAELIATVLDIVIVGLLVATLVYAFTLNRNLSRLRGDRQAMAQLIHELGSACSRAESAIGALREVSVAVDRDFKEVERSAKTSIDELRILVDTGERLATRIERAATGLGRAAEPRAIDTASALMERPAAGPAKASPKLRLAPAPKPGANGDGTKWSFGSLLTGDEEPFDLTEPADHPMPAQPLPVAGRSRAERDLVAAIAAARKAG